MRSKRRCIPIRPANKIFYVVDANFLANKRINEKQIQSPSEQGRVISAKKYWSVIDKQLDEGLAMVYVLDLCIAETFKVLAKKYYNNESIFKNHTSYTYAKRKLHEDLHLSSKKAKASVRSIKYHDIQTNRDIVISVDRFFEKACKQKSNVSVVDLMILATSKYLIDFYGIDRDDMKLITQDCPLYELAKSYQDLPVTFNPSYNIDSAEKVFV